MVSVSAALATRPLHEVIDVCAPSYTPKDERALGMPALHRFDTATFVQRFLEEAGATADDATAIPPSLLDPLDPRTTPDDGTFDANTLGFLGTRFRKLFQPVHFRFYVAACELRCRVPGTPSPTRQRVKKVELVIRRVPVRRDDAGKATVAVDEEWAWAKVPPPYVFGAAGAPDVAIDLAPRLTGNTHTWFPIPKGEDALPDEQRFPMNRAGGTKLESRGLYFGYLPLASGEMYGPRAKAQTPDPTVAQLARSIGTKVAEVGKLPRILAPSKMPMASVFVQAWRQSWEMLLGMFTGGKVNGPAPKFEPPPLRTATFRKAGDKAVPFDDDHSDPPGCWAYVVRCVATYEPTPGCLVEHWGPATLPAVIAPHYDPFGGRPTQIEIPSLNGIAQMIGPMSNEEVAARGGLNVGLKRSGCTVTASDPTNLQIKCGGGICFFGIPLFTICAYLMFGIALILLFPVVSFLLALKLCIPPSVSGGVE
jgi:hypothetical protein